MNRRPLSHFSFAAILALLVALAAAPTGMAAERDLFFGSPGASNFGLSLSPANPGGQSSYQLRLTNNGPSTLTQVMVTGGLESPTPAANPNFVPPDLCTPNGSGGYTCLPSLPAGAHYLAVYVAGGFSGQISCSLTFPVAGGSPGAWDGLRCPVANMPAGSSVQIRLVVSLPVTTSPLLFWNEVQIKEGSSGTGANQDAFFTRGRVTPRTPDCTLGGVANYFTAGQPLSIGIPTSCSQSARISGATFTDGVFAGLQVNPASTQCAPGITSCFGGLFQVQVVPGTPIAGTTGVSWRIRWTWGAGLTKVNPKGFIHFRDGYPADPTAFDVMPFTNKTTCDRLPTNCWTPVESTKAFFEVIVVTPENGTGRGY